MLVLLGEVGGIEEYTVCDLLKEKRITKPIVAWCIGTCADMFSTDVQVSLKTLTSTTYPLQMLILKVLNQK